MARSKKPASLPSDGPAGLGTRSMTDLARELGILISTVSRALSGHPGVGPATKARVLKLAQDYHYQPNQLASALRKGQSKLLGIVVPHIDRRFSPSVVQGIEMAANQAGYSNDTFTAVMVPALTTIDQCPEEMARAAVRLLIDVIEAGNISYVPRKVLLPRLLVHGSSLRQVKIMPDVWKQPTALRPQSAPS